MLGGKLCAVGGRHVRREEGEKMRKLEGGGKINFCFSNLLPQTLSEAILRPNAPESVRPQTSGEAINRYGKQPLEM